VWVADLDWGKLPLSFVMKPDLADGTAICCLVVIPAPGGRPPRGAATPFSFVYKRNGLASERDDCEIARAAVWGMRTEVGRGAWAGRVRSGPGAALWSS